jgi:hypothetical protein
MGDEEMKLTKTLTFAGVSLGALVLAVALSGGSVAIAQTPAVAPAAAPTPAAPPAKAAAPAPAASNIPRHPGVYRGDKVDAQTYAPSCPVYTIGMDAAAIQESSSRAFVEGEARRFENIRERWDAYEDCLTENARLDIDVVRNSLGDTLSAAAANEASVFNAMQAAATTNIERISKMPVPKAPKAPRGAPAVAAPVAAAVALSPWTNPTGRFVGSLTGMAMAPVYMSGCPDALGGMTPATFNAEATRDGFNNLLTELRAKPERINQARACRQENGQDDYEAIQKTVQDGVNAVFVPSKSAFEREYAAVRFQLNEHRKAGGLLAPPEMSRPKAPAAKTKAKKK